MEVKLITTDEQIKKININSFQDAKHYVSSLHYKSPLEMLNMPNGTLILIDEEGKLKGLPYNEEATKMAHENALIYPSDYIVGDAILVEDVDEFDAISYK